ncbi:hypothetical protein LCGC14_1676290 [marine sediment metagenome]|uniref:site-specific DNA-methyltransferase (adenine-specific) n=1 Tax=marine sediment metagenome TaxID=412755 RepID=A0A0F9KPR6_9ZZZZ
MSALITDKKLLKRLNDIMPFGSGRRLYQEVYDKILIAGVDFTPDKKDEMQENYELFRKILAIHTEFREKAPFRDLFGEYLFEYGKLNAWTGQFFTPYTVCDFIVEMTMSIQADEEPPRILDPAAGTGRFMLSTAKYYHKEIGQYNFLFTNVDIDPRVHTYCVLNAILYNIPSINIHGDALATKYYGAFATIPVNGWPIATWHKMDHEKLQEIQGEAIRLAAEAAKEQREARRAPEGMERYTRKLKKRVRDKPVRSKAKPKQRTLGMG